MWTAGSLSSKGGRSARRTCPPRVNRGSGKREGLEYHVLSCFLPLFTGVPRRGVPGADSQEGQREQRETGAASVDSGARVSWLMRKRRLSKDYERKVQTSETLIELAMIRIMLRRLARAT